MRKRDAELLKQGMMGGGVALLGIVLGVMIFFPPSAPSRHPSRSPRVEEEAEEPAGPPRDLEIVDARKVLAFYERNEIEADSALKNRWFAVRGRVATIGRDLLGTPYITLDCGHAVFSVQCFFSTADESILAKIRPGDSLIIAGVGAGKLGNVLLKQCSIYGR